MYFRMMPDWFNEVLNFIKETIKKKYTDYQKPIPPEKRLEIALR